MTAKHQVRIILISFYSVRCNYRYLKVNLFAHYHITELRNKAVVHPELKIAQLFVHVALNIFKMVDSLVGCFIDVNLNDNLK